MRQRLLRAGSVLAILLGSGGCAAPRILGKATLVDENGAPIPGAAASGVTMNFINLGGKIEDSIATVQTDAQGNYKSAELPPGKYTVEAVLPGYVIGSTTVILQKHGAKKAPFALKKIREAKGRSVKESQDENIPNPGEVKIKPPR
jgi:hypothetical protein